MGLLADGDGELAVEESATIYGQRPGTVVTEFFHDGELVSQKVVDLVEPLFYARIELSLLEEAADSFRISVDQPVRDALLETNALPAVFHIVEAERPVSRADRRRILETLGSLRSAKRLSPEARGRRGGVCN